MSTTTVRSEIAQFAADVRAHLDDLPVDDVDELVDGLDADLSDQAAEAGDSFEIPDAAAYAAELRAAAGLPERGPAARTRHSLRARWSAMRRRVVSTARGHRFSAWLLDTLLALRPVWWVLRAAVLYLLLVPLAGNFSSTGVDLVDRALAAQADPRATLLLAALLLVSIQWGRGKWAPVPWLRVVRTVVSVIAVIALPLLWITVNDARGVVTSAANAGYAASYTPGLSVDGQRVRNIFAYDVNGDPIEHAQLFDQDGRPLTTVGPSGQSEEWDYYFYGGGGPWTVAEREIGRQPVWNVFPLREISVDPWADGRPEPDDAVVPLFPFPQVPAVVGTRGAAETSATPGPTLP